MNTLNLSTPQEFQHFSLTCKIQFLKTCPKEFIRFSKRVDCQSAARKLVRSKKKSRPKVHRRKSRTVFKKKNLEATKKSNFVPKRIIAHKKLFPPSSFIICLEMDQFVLVPVSVYDSSNNSTIVAEQELPKYKPEQTPTYHIDTLKKENNQQLRKSAFPLLDKILESARIKLSNFNTLILDGTETGVLLNNFAQRLKRRNVPIPGIYFTLIEAASITPDIVFNSHAKGKEGGACIPFKI